MVDETDKPTEKKDVPSIEKDAPEFDINKLIEEIGQEEEANRKLQEAKLKELSDKTVTKSELKNIVKENLKYNMESKKTFEETLAKQQEEYKKQIDELNKKLESISSGSKAKQPVESDPFTINKEAKDDGQWDDVKALKHFGVLR